MTSLPGYLEGDPDAVVALYRVHFRSPPRPPELFESLTRRIRASFTTGGIPKARAIEEEVCRREVEVMRAAASLVPVPAVREVCLWQRHAVLLLAWCPGRTIDVELRRRPWRAGRLGKLFGRPQAAIHRVAAPEVLSRQSDAWIDRAGDPRADVARTIAILRIEAANAGRPAALVRAAVSRFEEGWRAGYDLQTEDDGDRDLFLAWAGAVMERDLAHKRGPGDLARIHRWTELWARRAGVR